jgi:hypothetical protein
MLVHRKAYSYMRGGKMIHVKATTYESRRHDGPRKPRSNRGVARPHRRGPRKEFHNDVALRRLFGEARPHRRHHKHHEHLNSAGLNMRRLFGEARAYRPRR